MRGKKMIIGIILITVGIIIDQVTKVIAFRNFDELKDYKCLPGIFKIRLVENEGAAWGFLSDHRWFLIIVTLIAIGFFIYLAKDFDLVENPIYSASFILIVTGTFGNFIDRIFNGDQILYGKVRDFLTFDFMNFPSFNFADMCLTVGVIFLSYDILFGATGVRWTKG